MIGIDTKNGLPIKPIKGLNVKEIDKIQLDILEYCKKTITPNYVPVIETTKYKNANIIVLWIYPGDERPYYVLDDDYKRKSKSKSCYVRKGSASVKATAKEINELIQISEYIGFGDRFYKWVLSDNKQPYNSFANGSAMRIGYVIDVAGSIAGQYYDIPDKVSEYNTSKLSDDLKEIYINL